MFSLFQARDCDVSVILKQDKFTMEEFNCEKVKKQFLINFFNCQQYIISFNSKKVSQEFLIFEWQDCM